MTTLVLVHGFVGGSDQWQLQHPLAGTRDVIAVDLPGFGRNAHLPAIDRIGGFADWTLDKLARDGIDRFDLLGHSMGGMNVQEMARRAPDAIRRLVLYGTGPVGALPDRFEPIETSMQRARDEGASATARRIAATWFRDRDAASAYESTARIAEKSGLPAILAGLQAMQAWSGEEQLAAIRARTLIVWGDQDRTYPWSQVETLWRAIPDCSIAVVPDCAHCVHAEAPELFNLLIERFLSNCPLTGQITPCR